MNPKEYNYYLAIVEDFQRCAQKWRWGHQKQDMSEGWIKKHKIKTPCRHQNGEFCLWKHSCIRLVVSSAEAAKNSLKRKNVICISKCLLSYVTVKIIIIWNIQINPFKIQSWFSLSRQKVSTWKYTLTFPLISVKEPHKGQHMVACATLKDNNLKVELSL